jgi:hypothetical protein
MEKFWAFNTEEKEKKFAGILPCGLNARGTQSQTILEDFRMKGNISSRRMLGKKLVTGGFLSMARVKW